MFPSGAASGGRNRERLWAARRVLMTSLGVATHRQNRQGRPGLETTGSGLPCHWAEFEMSAMSSQGPDQGADSSREEEGELLGGQSVTSRPQLENIPARCYRVFFIGKECEVIYKSILTSR